MQDILEEIENFKNYVLFVSNSQIDIVSLNTHLGDKILCRGDVKINNPKVNIQDA